MAVANAAALVGILVLGAIPFCAMGLMIGYAIGSNSAPGIVNLIHLPLSFASGLWFPIEVLPNFLQHMAVVLPPYHLAQLALEAVGARATGSAQIHWEVLLGFTLICLGVACIAAQRDEGKLYG